MSDKYSIGDKVCGSLLLGDGSIQECTIRKLDAGISRDAFIVETPSRGHSIMLVQSIVKPDPPSPSATPPAESPIPDGVYFVKENMNFYDEITHHGQGLDFRRRWWRRRNEFPQHGAQPDPAESPDDWVPLTGPPQHIIRSSDECRPVSGPNRTWDKCRGLVGQALGVNLFFYEFRCRRTDLPVVPDKLEKTIQMVKDIAEVGILPADKPRMRQVTLREYLAGTCAIWTSSTGIDYLNPTGRTAVAEVPE